MPFYTIRQLIDQGHRIGAYCTIECGWHERMDLQKLGEKLGFDFEVSAYTLNHRLRCKKCGQMTVTIRFHQKVTPIKMFDTSGKIG